MGSFNQPCFVSKVTIGVGDRVYFIPLKHSDDYCPRNNTLFNTGEMFRPVMLPILGEYDDYGRVIPDRTESVLFLERHFNHSIEWIIEPDNKLYDAGVFVHESVYNAIGAQFYRDYDGKKKNDYDFNHEFYKMSQALKREVEHTISSIRFYKDVMIKHPEHAPEDKGFLQRDIDNLKNLSFYLSNGGLFDIWIRKFPEFEKMYRKIFITGKLKEEMINFTKFDYNLYCCNSAYIPTAAGQQYGNHYMVREMLKAATKLNNEKIQRDKDNRNS